MTDYWDCPYNNITDENRVKYKDERKNILEKITHEIKIKIDKNCNALYDDAISFSLIQVKKIMFQRGAIGSFVDDTTYRSKNQLIVQTEIKYRLNTENGGFTPDKSRGPKAPRDLSGVNPTFEVFYRLKTYSRRFC